MLKGSDHIYRTTRLTNVEELTDLELEGGCG